MVTQESKLRIIAEMTDKATGSLKRLGLSMEGVGKSADKTSKVMKRAGQMWKAALVGMAVGAGKLLIDSVKLAARVETLGVVVDTLGATAGYTETELRGFEDAIRSQGITTQNTRQAMAQLIQSHVDLAHGADLARIAQDTAVIANINSSEAFQRLTTILQTGNILMGRTMGLTLDFAGAQKELAAELGKSTAELSDAEVMQARLNEVRKAGTIIEGTYEAAMGTSGKMMSSMARLTEELQLLIGEQLLPEFTKMIELAYEVTKGLLEFNRALDTIEESSEYTVDSFLFFERVLDSTGNVVANTADEIIALAEAIREAEKPVETAVEAMTRWRVGIYEAATATDKLAVAADGLAEAERGVALALSDVTAATLAQQALSALTTAFEEGLITEEQYKIEFSRIADVLADMESSQIAAHLALFELNQDLATGATDALGYSGEIIKLAEAMDLIEDKHVTMTVDIVYEGEPIGYQHGGSFTVPPGFSNDTYPILTTSGERVQITPAGQTPPATQVPSAEAVSVTQQIFIENLYERSDLDDLTNYLRARMR